MVTALLLTSTHHIPTHHHAMRAWNDDHLILSKTKLAQKFYMGNVTLFTCLTSPWRCHKIKCTLWVRFLNRKSLTFFWQLPLNIFSSFWIYLHVYTGQITPHWIIGLLWPFNVNKNDLSIYLISIKFTDKLKFIMIHVFDVKTWCWKWILKKF